VPSTVLQKPDARRETMVGGGGGDLGGLEKERSSARIVRLMIEWRRDR